MFAVVAAFAALFTSQDEAVLIFARIQLQA